MVESLNEVPASDQKTPAPFQNMTVEEFRAHPGCEGYTEEQAETVLQTLVALADLIAENIRSNSQIIDCQWFVSLNQQNKAA